ncbi:MAG: lgt 1 [Bradyrhizobium sp.]|nr:lgt 1 [Bradyrhizobium sp.]
MIFPQPPNTQSRWIGRRYLFNIGVLRVSSFAAMLYSGYLAGLVTASIFVLHESEVKEFALATLAMLLPALLGARLWFALEHPREFINEPSKIFQIREGGAALYGGLLLSVAISPLILRATGLDFWHFWDGAAIVLLVGLIVTRFGCLMNGCCGGRETGGLFGIWLPNFVGHWRRRFPTQIMESAVGGILLVSELSIRDQLLLPGALFLSAVAAYGASRLFLELTRDEARLFGWPTRLNMAFSAFVVVIAGGLYLGR